MYPCPTLSIENGTRLGHYEITGALGAGGMGEVYRAIDRRLDRQVAIKILPAEYRDNEQLRSRFEREAKVISSLSHPHICTIHDVGHEDGIDYLVLELLEGDTVAERLLKGPLPVAQVLRYGIEIADALDKAHRQGIVHRDLKPGNIMLTKTGAKLLDFGLAKSSSLTGFGAEDPTRHRSLTQEGTIIGTFQYMAPEQLEGREADARTDIFAFGATVYEMATGKRAFDGKSKASLIASILDRDPVPISTVQPMTPPGLDRTVQICLAKDPDDRWQSARDLSTELKWIAEGGSQAGLAAPVVARRRRREQMWIVLAAALGLTTMSLAAIALRHKAPDVMSIRSSIEPPPGVAYKSDDNDSAALTISPDGRYLTFSGIDTAGKVMLWLRPLNSLEAHPIEGSEGGTYPFWSPDSRSIGFATGGKLKRAEVAGGPAVNICDVSDPRPGSWNRDGVILFAPNWRDPLYRVSASGGTPTPVTQFDKSRSETTHRHPWFLPDGEHFLYLAGTHLADNKSDLNAIYVGSLSSKERKLILRTRSNVIYVAGYLLFARETSLMAQHFDVKKLELLGEPVRIADNVRYDSGFFRSIFGASENGTIVYSSGGNSRMARLTSFDRAGKKLHSFGEASELIVSLRPSPDGTRVAVQVGDTSDIWLYDLQRGGRSRLTSDPLNEIAPLWSPDGKNIVFSSDRTAPPDLFIKPSDGTASESLLLHSGDVKMAGDWSRDGRYLSFDVMTMRDRDHADIWILPMTGERKPFAFLQGPSDERAGTFSPDGKWLAYVSNESGRYELHVTSFPNPGTRQQLSTTGAKSPGFWTAGGKEILYLGYDDSLMSIRIKPGPTFDFDVPQPVSKLPRTAVGTFAADLSGQKLYLAVPDQSAPESVTLVTSALPAGDH